MPRFCYRCSCNAAPGPFLIRPPTHSVYVYARTDPFPCLRPLASCSRMPKDESRFLISDPESWTRFPRASTRETSCSLFFEKLLIRDVLRTDVEQFIKDASRCKCISNRFHRGSLLKRAIAVAIPHGNRIKQLYDRYSHLRVSEQNGCPRATTAFQQNSLQLLRRPSLFSGRNPSGSLFPFSMH